jgi:hypothetical protein
MSARSAGVGSAGASSGPSSPLPDDLAADLKPYVATLAAGSAIFPLPVERGAEMLRVDLKRAGIRYRDASGLVFDFHSLRCEFGDAGRSSRGVSPVCSEDDAALDPRAHRPLMANGQSGFPRNLRDPIVSSVESRTGDRVNNSGPRRCTRPPGSEENEWTRGYRQAKATKCGGTGGRRS